MFSGPQFVFTSSESKWGDVRSDEGSSVCVLVLEVGVMCLGLSVKGSEYNVWGLVVSA